MPARHEIEVGVAPDEPGDEAIAVETYVESSKGRWVVEMVVVFPDEVVRKRITDYPTKRHAEIAADWMKRAAARDLPPPSAPQA